MSTVTPKAVVKEVEITDIRVGDKLMQDIVGQKDRALLMQGQVIGTREILFLRKQLAAVKPKLAAEKYPLGAKTPGAIYRQDGSVLVRAGQVVTAEALAPLLDEGFEEIPGEGDQTVFYRKTAWPDDKPWHIGQLNPSIKVETTTYLDDEGKEVAQTKSRGQVAVGDKDATASDKSTAKVGVSAKAGGKPARVKPTAPAAPPA